jgi:homoserine kinase
LTDHKLAHVTVSVPASTSNLGPGFDCLGLALGLRNELTVELWKNPGPTVVHITGEGQGSLPLNEKNLLVQSAYRALPRHLPGRLVFRALNRIPLARGLGSSAAAAVAGLWAGARLLAHCRFSDEELERMAVDLEGHPDNVAPCVHGGLTASLTVNSQPRSVKLKIHPSLSSVVCIPSFELATKKARAALPRTVTLADATHNTSRAILLVRALENGRIEHLNELMDDPMAVG